MGQAIEVVFYREGDRWLAQALNVDVSSFGDSLNDARDAIKEALELYFEDEPGTDVPEAAIIRQAGLTREEFDRL